MYCIAQLAFKVFAENKYGDAPGDHAKGKGRQHQDDNGRTGHLHAGLARLFRLLRNARGADSPHSLGPTATAGRSVAPMENPTAPPRGTHRKWGPRVGCKEHGRQRPRSLVSRPQQSSLYWALKCILQIARPPILVPIVLAQLLEPPCTDPYARWCGRGGAARLPPIPIIGTSRHLVRCSDMSEVGGRPEVTGRLSKRR